MSTETEVVQYKFVGDGNLGDVALNLTDTLVKLNLTLEELSKGFERTTEAEGKAEEGFKGAAEEGKKAADEAKSLGDVLKNKTAQGFAAASAVALAYVAGLSKLASVTAEYSAAGTEQTKIDQQLADNISRSTKTRAEAEAQYKRLSQVIGEFADATGLGDEELSKATSTIIAQTGKLSLTTKDLTLVQGLAAQGQKEITDAAADYAKLLKGDMGVLEEYTTLTKGQIAALEAIPSEAERVRKAQEILAKQYATTGEKTQTAELALKRLEGAKGDLVQKIGQVINASGALQAILNPVTDAFKALEGETGNNQKMLTSIALTVADKVVLSFRFLLEVGAGVIGFWQNLKLGIKGVELGLDVWASSNSLSMAKVKLAIVELSQDALEPLFERFDLLLEYGERLASLSGIDALEQGFADARDELDRLSEGLGDLSDDAYDNVIDAQEHYNRTIADGSAEIQRLLKEFGATEEGIKKVEAVIAKMQAGLAAARVAPQGVLGPELGRGQGSATAPRANLAEQEAGITARKLKLDKEIAALELQRLAALREDNSLRVAQLEYAQALKQAEADTAETKDRGLRQAQLAIAQEQARQDFAQKRAELATEEVDKLAEANQARDNSALLQVQLAALTTQDSLQRSLLELEAQRLQVQLSGASPLERQIELIKIQQAETELVKQAEAERFDAWGNALAQLDLSGSIFDAGYTASLNEQITLNNELLEQQVAILETQQAPRERIAELQDRTAAENAALQRNIELQQKRTEALGKAAQSSAQLAVALVAMAKAQGDFNKAQDAGVAGLGAAVGLAAGLTDALITSQKKRAQVMMIINGAAAIGAYGLFAETLLPNYLTAGINYTASAVQYGLVAGQSASVGSTPGVSSGGQPARFADAPSLAGGDAGEATERTASAIADAIARSNRAPDDRSVIVDLRGATLLSDDPRSLQVLGNSLGDTLRGIVRDELSN